MMSNRSSSRRRSASLSRSTWVNSNRASAISARASRSRRASPGLSSTRRTLMSGFMEVSCLRQLDDGEPEILDHLYDPDELLEIDRLGDVAVRVQVVGAQNVALGRRGREHDHRDLFEIVVSLDLLQHFAAVLFRQVQVEQDQVRLESVGVFAFAPEKGQRFDPVLHDAHVVQYLALLQRLHGQPDVAGVVLDQQYFGRSVRASYHRTDSPFASFIAAG